MPVLLAATPKQYRTSWLVCREGLSKNCRWVQRRVIRYDLPGKTSLGAVTKAYRSTVWVVAAGAVEWLPPRAL